MFERLIEKVAFTKKLNNTRFQIITESYLEQLAFEFVR